jgi:hypothetical protein
LASSTPPLRLALALATSSICLLVLSPRAFARTASFRTPSNKVVCAAVRIGTRSANIRCDLRFVAHKAVFLSRTGRARLGSVTSYLPAGQARVLRAGTTHRYGVFTCVAQTKTMSCRSPAGHGFAVGPAFQTVY